MYKHSLLTAIISFCLILSSNGQGIINIGFKNWLPEDFDPKNTTLLIQENGHSKTQEKAETFMTDNYSFKYEFVSLSEIENNTKFKSSKYALVFIPGAQYTYQAIIYNRETQKQHVSKYNGDYMFDLKSVIKELNKKFNKNE